MPMNVSSPRLVARLTDPTLTAGLSHFVRARVPDTEVEDIVQATLSDALQAEQHPEEDEDIVRWVYGICRHKVIDWFRRMRREIPRDLESQEDAVAADSAPTSAMDLMRWARKQLPKGKENEQTLEWMLREGDGEKLETIAAEANVPAPRVRQRVSRLRRYFKAKWAAQTAAVAALLLVTLAIFFALRGKKEEIAPRPEPSLEPSPTAPPPLPQSLPAVSTEPSASAAPSASAVPSVSSTPPPAPSGFDPKPSFTKPTAAPTFTPPPKAGPNPKKGGGKMAPSSMDPLGSTLPAPTQQQAPVPPPPAPTDALQNWGDSKK